MSEKQKLIFIIIIAVSFCAIVCGIIWTMYFVNRANTSHPEEAEQNYRSGSLYYNSLSGNQQIVYNAIADAAESVMGYTEQFVTECSEKEFHKTVRAVFSDRPELFYVEFDALELCKNADGRMLVRMNYKSLRSEIELLKDKFEEKIREINELAVKQEGTFEKELFIHDYITDNSVLITSNTDEEVKNGETGSVKTETAYSTKAEDETSAFIPDVPDDSYIEGIPSGDYSDSAYGVIVLGCGNVKGYALAMKLLLNRLGESCFLVFGNANGSEHVWNLVYIDEKFYHTDVAWDDADITYCNLKFHAYFNLNEAEIAKSRTLDDPEIIPYADSDYDYYSALGLKADDEAALKKLANDEIYKACSERREYIELCVTYTDDMEKVRKLLSEVFAFASEQINRNGIGVFISSKTDLSTEGGNDGDDENSIGDIGGITDNEGKNDLDISVKKIIVRPGFRIYLASNDRAVMTVQLFYSESDA